MAATIYAQCLRLLKDAMTGMETIEACEGTYRGAYLGSYMSLDPCGRYHHCLSPNSATDRCERFWEAIEEAASRLGGWIEGGEGDPTDIFFCLPADEEKAEEEECAAAGVEA